MEPVTAFLRDGVLSHLETLEARALGLARQQEAQETQRRQQERVEALSAKIRDLRRQRDELRARAKARRTRRLPQPGAPGGSPDPTPPRELTEKALLEMRLERTQAVLQAFHWTGISGKQTKPGACLYIGTAFEGTLLDRYYVDLVGRDPPRIRRHSIPPFIPLEQLAARHLRADMRGFLLCLSQHLNAYASRKYQADRFQSRFAACLSGPMQRNSACNLLSFTYRLEQEGQSFHFAAKLAYADPTSSLPTDVTVTVQGTPSALREERRAAHAVQFRQEPLHRAFATLSGLGLGAAGGVSEGVPGLGPPDGLSSGLLPKTLGPGGPAGRRSGGETASGRAPFPGPKAEHATPARTKT
ncbi:centromere protein O [Ornithorhynchus anatinus]|uniref:Centromere protein O n=1 Tax=Ornithorhynchus anatinus TaxID=9258 RepID=A0A6I8PDL8_ORNAN|nr:centromere protein O [Ornithorhynchus anatinus]